MKACRIDRLYDLRETIAVAVFEGVEYPWEVLPKIKDFIIELGNSPEAQLYNLMYDIGEKENVADRYPEVAKDMADRIAEILKSSQTR